MSAFSSFSVEQTKRVDPLILANKLNGSLIINFTAIKSLSIEITLASKIRTPIDDVGKMMMCSFVSRYV